MTIEPKSRRRTIVQVPHSIVLAFLRGDWSDSEYIGLPRVEGLPATAKVVSVFEEAANDCFLMVVEDESFEETREGERMPQLALTFDIQRLQRGEPITA